MSQRVAEGMAFVEGLELPYLERSRGRGSATGTPHVFDQTKNQAMVVGADIVSFVTGTELGLRTAIMNCSLLAQLAATRKVQELAATGKVQSREDTRSWYEAYFDILGSLGWVVQDRGFSEHREVGDDFEAHQSILSVAAVVLGPATTALAVVQSTLAGMKSMSKGSWMSIFKRESQAAKAARFQVTVAEPSSQGGSVVSLMAFELNAKATLTQVLFFKFRSTDITLRHSSGRVTIDSELLAGTAPVIAKRVADYTQDYVENIPI
jgi:hypothetical protein